MSRVKPRNADYSSAPRMQPRKWGTGMGGVNVDARQPRSERKGHLVQEGKPKGRLKELLATPARARDEEVEKELDTLEDARRDKSAFLRAMTEGEE